MGAGRGTDDWEAGVHKRPSAIAVAKLAETHGYSICCERWPWLNPRTISSLIRQGRKQMERRAQA